MSNDLDLFDDDGELDIPTMRGSANLDVQDYQRPNGIDSSILDDELQEDVPSTPGRNPGAAPATDVEGTAEFDLLGENEELSMDDDGMEQSDYGSYPWGPGGGGGYRPHAMQRTDMSLRALGEDEDHQPQAQPVERDEMYNEPEVVQAMQMDQQTPWPEEYHGNRNQMPSNRGVDPRTLYDRDSYEDNESSQATIGSGIFGMEEGVTWRPRDGIFANQYALPAYIAEEDEVGVQQSDMWDTTANEWRVTQTSQGGVPMMRDAKGKPPWKGAKQSAYSPFRQESEQGVSGAEGGSNDMRPESTGPRSHVEAFGRGVSACIMREATRRQQGAAREKFLQNALDALGPNQAARCKQVADHLVQMGYRPDVALTDAIAHCVMHATVEDLRDKRRKRPSDLPRLDLLSKRLGAKATKEMGGAANKHIAPLINDNSAMRKDLGALFGSPAARGMGQFGAEASNNKAGSNPPQEQKKGLLRPRNLVIAGLLGVGGYLVYRNRDEIADSWRRMTGQE